MIRDANGQFIDFSIQWDTYGKIVPFILETANGSHLNCYDPQTEKFYPADELGELPAK